jgi:ribosomal protein S4
MKRSLRNIQQEKLNKNISKKNVKKTRFDVIYRALMVKRAAQERKVLRSKRQSAGKIRRRKMRAIIKLQNTFRTVIDRITDPAEQQKFLKLYGHLLRKDRIYTPFERKLISGMKAQKVLRRKKYKLVSLYKRKNLHRSKKRQYWDLFQNRKVRKRGSCYFVAWHSKNIYSLKRVFRFFYGYLKNNVWKKAYVKSKRKKNKVLNFLSYLENRLVVVLYRMNLAFSLMQAKQFIRHGFVYVNGKKIIYRNYKVKKNDVITVNRQMFLDFILKSQKIPLDFMYNSVVKPELPHLYVKHRLLTGIFLYDPLHNYNVLSKQHPEFFFGKGQLHYENINFHQVSKNARNFKEYTSKKLFNQKRFKKSPFIEKYHDIFKNESSSIPLKKVKLVLSYFLKN